VDLVVVGAGTAGIPAAMAAADDGAHVVLLEKRPRVGGMLHISGGQFCGAGTRRQRERGIDDDPVKHLRDVDLLSHGKANLRLAREAVDRLGETVDWLEDLGFDFHPDTPRLVYGHELYSVPRTYHGRDDGRSLLRLFERELMRRVVAGSIDLRLSCRVRSLLQGATGAVHGVEVEPADGRLYSIEADAVVLATGGYAANRALVQRFQPRYQEALTACLDHASGDGLLLAEELGAALTSSGEYIPTMGQIPDPERPGFTLSYDDARLLLIPYYRQPHEVWVNLRGERWVAEDTESPEERERGLLRQPALKMAVVWDQRALDEADPLIVPPQAGWTRDRIRAEAERARFVWTAESPGALAGWMGVDADGLERTIERYNRFVAERHDSDFGRRYLPAPISQPPFYGVMSQASMLMSREGLRVDTQLQVLDADERPIDGLYAIGEVLGASQLMGDSFVGGMSVGPAIAFGRWLGHRLAQQVVEGRAAGVAR
jgi:fumarate reductase flavoprotein subunit